MKLPSKNVKNHENLLFDYSMRQKIGDPGSISTQNMFPLTPIVPKPPQLPYGAKLFCQFFCFFNFLPCWTPGSSRYQVQVPSSGTKFRYQSSGTKFRYQSSGTIVQVPSSGTKFSTKFIEIQFFEIQFFELQFFEIQFFESNSLKKQ